MENTELMQETPVTAPQPTPGKKEKKAKGPKKRKKWLKPLIIVGVLVLVFALVFRGCLSSGKAALSSTYMVEAAQVRDMNITVSGTGTIQPIDSYQLTALVKGEVLAAPFEEGETVEKDALLFRIDAGTVENSISQAKLSLEQAQLAYNQLLRNQKDTKLTANANGVIQSLPFEAGDNVTAGSVVATILDNSTMKLAVPFHAESAAGFFVGQAANVAVDGTTEVLTGTVDEISATSSVGPGGTLVRTVTVKVLNPGALDVTSMGTATIGGDTCSASGSFAYAANKQVVAKTSGELATLYVKEGDPVADGQALGAFKGDTISDQIETARLSVRSAELALKNAQDNLDNYTIQAPISGTIIEKNYKVGDNVDPSTGSTTGTSPYMAVIYDMTTLTFDLKISELDIGKIQLNQSVEITSDALPGKSFAGYVDKVNINGITQNGMTNYPVTIKLEGLGSDLQQEGLYPGMNISAKVMVEQVGQVLCVPVDAVARGNMVTVPLAGALDEAGKLVDPTKVELREVILGRSDSNFIEITGGLAEGETILIQTVASNAMSMMMGG